MKSIFVVKVLFKFVIAKLFLGIFWLDGAEEKQSKQDWEIDHEKIMFAYEQNKQLINAIEVLSKIKEIHFENNAQDFEKEEDTKPFADMMRLTNTNFQLAFLQVIDLIYERNKELLKLLEENLDKESEKV